MRAGGAALAAVTVAVTAGGAAARHSQAPPPTLRVPEDARASIVGAFFAPGFPRSTPVEPAGDVNGDGNRDLLVLNVQGHGGDATRSYLILGGRLPATLRLDRLGPRGVTLLKSPRGDRVIAAGDINGDKRADLLRCGRTADVLLGGRSIGSRRGDTIVGGYCGTSPGDVDGDGLADLLFFRSRPDGSDLRSVVVFGARGPRRTIDLARIGRRGFQIAAGRFDYAEPVGDVNGDERADLGIPRVRGGATIVRLVFGRRRAGTLVVGDGGPAVVATRAATFGPAGDVNGDGIGDLAVAEPGVRVCLVFGRRAQWPSRSGCTATQGLIVRGADRAHAVAYPVEPAGDIDGDGNGDVLVAVPGAPRGYAGAETTGAVYLVYGRREPGRVLLPADARVLEITGGRKLGYDGFGHFSGPGDVTADGKPDIVLGSGGSGDGWVLSP